MLPKSKVTKKKDVKVDSFKHLKQNDTMTLFP